MEAVSIIGIVAALLILATLFIEELRNCALAVFAPIFTIALLLPAEFYGGWEWKRGWLLFTGIPVGLLLLAGFIQAGAEGIGARRAEKREAAREAKLESEHREAMAAIARNAAAAQQPVRHQVPNQVPDLTPAEWAELRAIERMRCQRPNEFDYRRPYDSLRGRGPGAGPGVV